MILKNLFLEKLNYFSRIYSNCVLGKDKSDELYFLLSHLADAVFGSAATPTLSLSQEHLASVCQVCQFGYHHILWK